jgi:hypothetical protein
MIWGFNPSIGPTCLCACMFIMIIIVIHHEDSLSGLNIIYVYIVLNPCLELTLQTPVSFGRNSPQFTRVSSFRRFLDHTQRRTTGRTPLDEWSARRRDLYLTRHNTQNRQTDMPPLWDSYPQSQQWSGHWDRLKAQWLPYLPPRLTWKISTFCPHSVCSVWIWE